MKIWKLCNEPIINTPDDLVITVDEKSLTLKKAIEACEKIVDNKINNFKTVLCFKKHTGKSEELRLIFMSMISNNNFNILEVDEFNDVDEEYAESVLNYEIDLNELKVILGNELGKLAEQLITDKNNPINNLMQSLIATTIKATSTSLETNAQNNDELIDRLKNAEASLQGLRVQVTETETKADNYKRCVDEQAVVIMKQKSEIEDLQDKLKINTEKLNNFSSNFGGQLKGVSYVEMDLDKLKTKLTVSHARIDVEHVLYFKELTPCLYINSFIMNLLHYIKINKKKNIICLIFDNSELSQYKYGKLKQINGSSFVANQTLKDESIVVVTDAAPQILEEALITHDLVLVYDRMNLKTDIIIGRNVHKFVVVNSQKELLEVKRATKLTSEQFITTFGTDKDSLSVRQIREYKQMSNGGKIMAYANMTCTKNNTDTIYERLLFTVNINLNNVLS